MSKNPSSCPEAAKFDIKFKCCFQKPDCLTCDLFRENPESQPETFVQLPTKPGKTDWNKMTKEQIMTVMLLIDWGNQFKQTKNQAYAMKAIATALENKLFPPLWALNAVGQVFNKFLQPTTKRDISNLFGCGPGKNLVKEMEIREKNRHVRYRINQKYANGWLLMGNKSGKDAVSIVEGKDGKANGAYEHIAKKDLAPAERLNRAFYKSKRRKKK